MKGFNKKYKDLLIKSCLFLIITYIIIPTIFFVISKNEKINFQFNFFSFPAYTLIMVVLFGVYKRDLIIKHKEKVNLWKVLLYGLLSIFSFAWYFFVKYSITRTFSNFAWLSVMYGLFYILGIVFIAFAIFGTTIFKKSVNSLLVFGVVTYFFYIITQVLWQLWEFLAYNAAHLVYWILRLFTNTASIKFGDGDPTLGVGGFEVLIGPPCSGIESLSMYLGLFILLIVYEKEKLDYRRTAIVFTIGLIGVYLLNILRLILILLIGTQNPDFALGLFHSQAGWLLFSGFVLLLLYFGYRWMRK